ncbi:phosphate:Na+ symporter [Ectothiorhodosinus mongolicus]|uniref:Phosphate:Na+ symporter n=1 Tax=Ectothiorhodosinus mongolicus TaxID=233100 RepID=A0A1R3VQ15_9GAMM|nr:Na/Pi symporter [Ectothiorhodosinus mongolicus]ULX57789.1 Na+/Picotransporter [Ectothiorhodosinus mongolicus]SIT65653.1 phosphate:Na+ symporter [Ectothiorhodosinus mongolicus]
MSGNWLQLLEVAALIVAGLGLLLVGIRQINENLRQLADLRLRRLLSQATESHRATAGLGLAAGAVAQSIHALILIMISLVTAGALDAKRAIPIINFANIGTSLLVLIAALDIRVAALFLVGLTGLLYYFDSENSGRRHYLIRALLGIGLLFLGLSFFKEGAKPLAELPLVMEIFSLSAQHFLIAFVVGAVLTLVLHSGATVTIIAMALAFSGVMDLPTAVMFVFGTGVGTGLGTLLLAFNQPGLGRQLALYQLLLKLAGLALLLPLFFIEVYLGVPLLLSGLQLLPLGITLQIALTYIIYQLACDVVIHPLHHRVEHFLEYIAPPTQEQVMGQPRFIYAGAEKDSASALALVNAEQAGLIERLPQLFDELRSDDSGPALAPASRSQERPHGTSFAMPTRRELHNANAQIAGITDDFLAALLGGQLAAQSLEQAIILKGRQQSLAGLMETLDQVIDELDRAGAALGKEDAAQSLVQNLVETLHMLLLTLSDVARDADAMDVALLQGLTADRSELMESIRQRLLNTQNLPIAARESLFAATSLFERCLWLIRRLSSSFTPAVEDDSALEPAAS